jgi:endonuclease/exonuclease/phosphatase family metal-dependent hydrolase
MRVLSFNIKGQAALWRASHVAQIAEVIRELQPDVAGLQEVHRRTWQSRFRDQASWLARLTGMELAFGRSFGDARREYGNALLTRGTIVSQIVQPLPGGGEPRSLLSATVDAGGLQLTAHVTHLAAWGRFGARTRLAQTEAVAKMVRAGGRPFVLMGDFNTRPKSDELQVFADGNFVLSCFAPDVVTHRATRSCLDYVFADPGWTVKEARVVARGPSDHWPLLAELTRSGAAAAS